MWKWVIWATIFYIHAGFLFYKAVDRVEGYVYDESYPEDGVYAYVGNDADNLIINSNVSSGFLALAGAFIIAGTLFIMTGAILKAIREKKELKDVESVEVPV